MTELRLAIGSEGTITHDGETYRIGQFTVEVVSAWQEWLMKETLDRLVRATKDIPNGLDAAIEAAGRMAAAGDFDLDGDISQRRLLTPDGMKQIIYLKVAQHHPTVEKRIIAEYVDKHLEEFITEHLLEKAVAEKLDPNADAPQDGGRKPIRWRTIIAQICDKYNVLPSDERIRRLTLWQIAEIIYHRRDDRTGAIQVRDEDDHKTEEDYFRERWRKWGLSEENISKKWDEFLRICGMREQLRAQRVAPEELETRMRAFERALIAKRDWGW